MAARSWPLFLFVAAASVIQARAQSDTTGFISIDCGLPGTASYVDDITGLSYVSDADFIDAGSNQNISASNISPNILKQFKQYLNLRSFPDGVRNCYTFRSLKAGNKYLIRATFFYGNYDSLSRPPIFDIYVGVDYWSTVNITDASIDVLQEAIVVVPDDFVQVCLVNTGTGTPFISGLELRPLKSSLYPQANATQGLVLAGRVNVGGDGIVRYPDDSHDRLWIPGMDPKWTTISTTEEVRNFDNDMFEAPSKVMQTAATPRDVSGILEFNWDSQKRPNDQSPGYVANFHFSELQILKNDVRQFYINRNGKLWYREAYTPPYLKSDAIYNDNPSRGIDRYNISLNATANSTLPPIINAVEVFTVISTTTVATDSQDVSAITAIKAKYHVQKHWTGDPCLPKNLAWNGLTCSYAISNPSITGVYGSNPNLCTNADSCVTMKGSSKIGIYIAVAVVLVVVIVSVAILLFCLLRQKKKGPTNNAVKPLNETPMSYVSRGVAEQYSPNSLQLENRQFTYKELQMITNNFRHVLGQGGFGYVYDGFLEDGTQVAVKLRSDSSNQGVKEFLAEAQILTRIHHKNLVSMIGYCKDGEYMALVYEYMSEGTLQEHIAGNGPNGRFLTWRQRVKIALESAQGLEYLHRGCNPPLIHRDVKATNILLNSKLEAKIADFGLSKAFSRDSDHISTNVIVGTPGYVDPEYHTTMQPTAKSDVYSFGVVLLELIAARPAILRDPEPTSIIKWARLRLARGNIESIVDPLMHGDYDVNGVWKVADIALKCTAMSSTERPTMTDVVAQLQECLQLEEGRARNNDGNGGGFYTGDSSELSTDVSQSSTALEVEHNFVRMPTMATGPVAR
ncbi:hypothetical protein EJB05_36742, partial [Eragrostis curvula]